MARIGLNRKPLARLLALALVGLLAWGYWWKANQNRHLREELARVTFNLCLASAKHDTDRCLAYYSRDLDKAKAMPLEWNPRNWTW